MYQIQVWNAWEKKWKVIAAVHTFEAAKAWITNIDPDIKFRIYEADKGIVKC